MDDSAATVFVVDDEVSVRESIKWLFNSISRRVETYDSAQAFLDANVACSYGCLILDVRMPGIGGMQLQDILFERHFHLPIIFLSAYADAQMGAEATRKGAVDFLQKPYRNQDLIDAVHAALDLSKELSSTDAAKTRYLRLLDGLSHREKEILDLIVRGRSNKLIARILGISHKTVEAHRANLINKLGAKSSSDLAQLAMLNNSHCRDCRWLLLPDTDEILDAAAAGSGSVPPRRVLS